MKSAIAVLSALVLMDYAAAAVDLRWKRPSSYMLNEPVPVQGYESRRYGPRYYESGREQDIRSNRNYDYEYRLKEQSKPVERKIGKLTLKCTCTMHCY